MNKIEKKLYHSPQLSEFGSLQQITQAGIDGGNDDGFTSTSYT